MYNNYFGFREKPFKLVPNPEYLFLSKTHEIALAHLTFAAQQGDGFVVIIGEVGTGKTTLCRNYLESLDDQTDSAYIFNPHLDTNDLLAGICHEYGMRLREKSTKSLLDILNLFLIKQNAAGRKVVLLIDEAQLLSTENLEMVRMLSNLETTKNKLLQIILVGQPELAGKLEKYELRQLAQRISLNYKITPLSAEDTELYIQHRIGIASKRYTQLFTKEACRLVYLFSKGIPRLINMVADRALLVAFSQDKPKVNKAIMQVALSELSAATNKKPASTRMTKNMWSAGIGAFFAILAAVLSVLYFSRDTVPTKGDNSAAIGQVKVGAQTDQRKAFKVPASTDVDDSAPSDQSTLKVDNQPLPKEDIGKIGQNETAQNAESIAESTPKEVVSSEPKESKTPSNMDEIEKILSGVNPFESRKKSASKLLSLWRQIQTDIDLIPDEVDDSSFFDIAARQYGFRNYEVWGGDWHLVKKIDLPAILTLSPPGRNETIFLNLVGQRGNLLQVANHANGDILEVDYKSISPYFKGAIHIFWKNIIGFDMIIGYGSDERAVLMVKNLLRKIGYDHITLSPEFDFDTKLAVRDFQASHQLKVDGLVGPLTKIMLLRKAGTTTMPKLISDVRTDS
jgi:general secretion pathway protein A